MERFLDTLGDSVCIWDNDRKLIFINRMGLKRLGYTDEILLQPNLGELIKIKENLSQVLIYAQAQWGDWVKGEVEIDEIEWKGKPSLYGIIKWSDDIDIIDQNNMLKNFIDNMSKNFYVKDLQGRYVVVNKSYAHMINSSVEKAIGKTDSDFWSEEDVKKLSENDWYICKTGETYVKEKSFKKEGKKQYYKITKSPILDNKGQVKYIGILMKNITLYKNLEYQEIKSRRKINHITKTYCANKKVDKKLKVLEEIESILKRCLETDEVNIWIYNETFNHIKPWFRTKISKAILGNRQTLPIKQKELDKYLTGKFKRVRLEEKCYRLCGIEKNLEKVRDRYVLQYAIIYRGEFLGVLSMTYKEYPRHILIKDDWMDVTCKQIALIIKDEEFYEELEEEFYRRTLIEDNLKGFLALSTDLIVEIDQEGYYKEINPSGSRLLGWSEEELLGIRWQDHIHPDDYESTEEFIKGYRKSNEEKVVDEKISLTNRYRCKDGTYKWLRWDGYCRKKGQNLIGTAKDVSYEKQFQEREETTVEIMQLDHIRNEFLANISHEFKTPMTIIMSVIQLIELSIKHDEIEFVGELQIKKYIDMIKQNTYRLLRLVNNLIDVTKIDAGYYELNLQNLNIVNVIEEITSCVAGYMKDRAVKITFDTEIEEEIIPCDYEKMEKVILNLLSNAIKYTGDFGIIDVNLRLEAENVVITVEDNGVGIASHKRNIIFERFIQGHDIMTRHCEGSGIGLSLVKSVIEMHGGHIIVASKEGEGTRFEVRLPRVQLDEDEVNSQVPIFIKYMQMEQCHIEFSDI